MITPDEIIGDFIVIPLESLRLESILDFSLYVKYKGKIVLYRSGHLPFTAKEKERLLENKVDKIYINSLDQNKYFLYLEKNLSEIVKDQNIPTEKKAEVVYNTSKKLMIDVLEDPRSGKNIERSKDLINNTLEFILTDKTSFKHILEITSFDYYTYTHSVNVSMFAIALGERIGKYDRKTLYELGLGALLHDVGKSKIDDAIINKKGPLTSEEFNEIKKHPIYGEEILKETDLIPRRSYLAVRQHHEKINGTGYPDGLKNGEIDEFGRITCIADVFDALTTKRSYKDALPSFPALKIMKEMDNAFDEYLFNEFVLLLGEKE
ncbi:hypothetical protein DRQ09_05200 [candidate division KSB1 bacterium]|nr:MAG: hypothetical protein DRQ09_05200 [candidate division KSB1 bacterium]